MNLPQHKRTVMQPAWKPCPGPLLKKGTTEVESTCGTPTQEFVCPACWARVSKETRRAFTAERARLRKCTSLRMPTLMKQLIAKVVTECAREAA